MKRAIEILVGLLALAVAALTFWVIAYSLVHPPETTASTTTLIGIYYALGLIAVALSVYAVRILVPASRVEGGHVIGLRGLMAFTGVYASVILLGVMRGTARSLQFAGGLVLLSAAVFATWKRVTGRRRSGSDEEDDEGAT